MSNDARPQDSSSWGRALLVVAAVAAVLGVGLGVAAFTVWSPGADVVLEVETVAIDPPFPSEAVEQPGTGAEEGTDAGPPLVPIKPAAISEADPAPPAASAAPSASVPPVVPLEPEEPSPWTPPTELSIADLGRSDVVRPVGLDRKGAMVIPGVKEVGWYEYGAVPGHPGATVLVAHVSWGGSKGPFHRLGSLDLGAEIEVRGDDGVLHSYEVVERTMYDKDALPGDLWRKTGPETLVLITCGGSFNSRTQRYDQNIVVYATPATSPAAVG